MAEMTAHEAIAALHNKQYQKHIGNGEYDYIHPLTDAECKGIESLIQQQAQTIELACRKLAKFHKCPPVVCDLSYHPGDAECVKHWQKWLEQQVKEGQ